MRHPVFILAMLLLAPVTTYAVTPYITFNGGLNTYAMPEANDIVDDLNLAIDGSDTDKIHDGFQIGAGVGLMTADFFTLELSIAHLSCKTGSDEPGSSMYFDIPATVIMLRTLAPLTKGSKVTPLIGAGMGSIHTGGSLSFRQADETFSYNLSGTSFYFEGTLGFDVECARGKCVELAVGYRQAKINRVQPSSWREDFPDYGGIDLDYSGMTARIAVRLFLVPDNND